MGGDTVYDCMAAAYDAGRVSQVDENMQALDVVDKLTPDVIARIESILNNKPE
jgi:hypothetical protein